MGEAPDGYVDPEALKAAQYAPRRKVRTKNPGA